MRRDDSTSETNKFKTKLWNNLNHIKIWVTVSQQENCCSFIINIPKHGSQAPDQKAANKTAVIPPGGGWLLVFWVLILGGRVGKGKLKQAAKDLSTTQKCSTEISDSFLIIPFSLKIKETKTLNHIYTPITTTRVTTGILKGPSKRKVFLGDQTVTIWFHCCCSKYVCLGETISSAQFHI